MVMGFVQLVYGYADGEMYVDVDVDASAKDELCNSFFDRQAGAGLCCVRRKCACGLLYFPRNPYGLHAFKDDIN
jgi:hypothetical protein